MQINSNIKKIYCFIQKELVCFFFKVSPVSKCGKTSIKHSYPFFKSKETRGGMGGKKKTAGTSKQRSC